MNEAQLGLFIKADLSSARWIVLPEFGILSYSSSKRIDLAAFKWKNEQEVYSTAFECKCIGSSRESFLAALGQAVEYQRFFPEVFIISEGGDCYDDQKLLANKLGLGYLTINEKGESTVGVEPLSSNNTLFDEGLFDSQIRGRAILALTFNELFPEAISKAQYGGLSQGELWIHDKPKGEAQLRVWTRINDAAFFGINVEAVSLIRNICEYTKLDDLFRLFSAMPSEYTIDLAERATYVSKLGSRILDRQKRSISIKGSLFENGPVPACSLTKEQIQKEIIDRSKELGYYTHLMIDKKMWDNNSHLTRTAYLKELTETKEILEQVRNNLWVS